MKAVTWQGKRKVSVETAPDPVIREPTDAIIEVTAWPGTPWDSGGWPPPRSRPRWRPLGRARDRVARGRVPVEQDSRGAAAGGGLGAGVPHAPRRTAFRLLVSTV